MNPANGRRHGQRGADAVKIFVERDRHARPRAILPAALVGRVVELGLFDGYDRVVGCHQFIPLHLRSRHFGQPFAAGQHAVDKRADFLGRPTHAMPVRHVHGHAQIARRGDQPVRLLIAVQRIGEVVGAVDEQRRTTNAGQVRRRVEVGNPAIADVGGHRVERTTLLPGAVLVQETTAIDGHRHFQLRIDAGDDAREVSAPANPGDANAPGIDLGPRSQQRMAAQDGGHGLIGPHVGQAVVVEGAKLCAVILRRSAVGQTLAIGPVACQVHGQSDIAPLGPQFGPFGKCLAAAAVHQQHGGKRSLALGPTVVSKHPARATLVVFRLVAYGRDQSICFAPFGMRLGGQNALDVPRPGRASGLRRVQRTAGDQQADCKNENGMSHVVLTVKEKYGSRKPSNGSRVAATSGPDNERIDKRLFQKIVGPPALSGDSRFAQPIIACPTDRHPRSTARRLAAYAPPTLRALRCAKRPRRRPGVGFETDSALATLESAPARVPERAT